MTREHPFHPLAISIGEPAGIGPDVIISAAAMLWDASGDMPGFFVIGDSNILKSRAKLLGIDIGIVSLTNVDEFDPGLQEIQVLPLSAPMEANPGTPSPQNGKLVIEAIERGVELVSAGKASGLVTAPIAKEVLYACGFEFPGHTEFLAELVKRQTGKAVLPVMMIAGPELKTVPVTIHIPLMTVGEVLTCEMIVETVRVCHHDLISRFGIEAPRIAVSGLNPHAGENGTMGREDKEIVAPAIAQLWDEGINAFGPLPADTMFHEAARKTHDMAVCMYHDQALIPAKTLAFDDGVNVTLGLPFIRTSPDHGTAFAIAGTGKAKPNSMLAAIRMAGEMARRNKDRPHV